MTQHEIPLASDLPDTIADTARLIRSGSLSPIEITDKILARIEAVDPAVNAHITVTADRAREQARKAAEEIARGRYRGPLHGHPLRSQGQLRNGRRAYDGTFARVS